MLAGQVIAGCSASVMVMVNEQLVLGPSTLTVVVPTGKKVPDGGVAITDPQLPKMVGDG